jgi:glycerate kinase
VDAATAAAAVAAAAQAAAAAAGAAGGVGTGIGPALAEELRAAQRTLLRLCTTVDWVIDLEIVIDHLNSPEGHQQLQTFRDEYAVRSDWVKQCTGLTAVDARVFCNS